MPLTSINPATQQLIKEYPALNANALTQKIDLAQKCFQNWRQSSMEVRSRFMTKVASVLKHNKNEYAQIITEEMGKTIKEALAEIEKCAWVCDYYAENAANFLEDEIIETDAQKSYACYRPLGIILAIMPWNFPFWQVFRFAAPALMAGNVGLLKHAPNVQGCANAIEKIFLKAGFPEGCFLNLPVEVDLVESIIENPFVKAVTLTGSGRAGSAVASIAGKHIKKTVLELGGSDAYIILEDADLDLAVDQCVKSRLLNSGQSCIGAKRFVVVESVYEDFLSKFLAQMKNAQAGDPLDESTTLGPLARPDLQENLHRQVEESVNMGAKCLLGGQIPDETGFFYPPTILENIKPGMPAYEEELFGPVAAIVKVKDEAEAIKIANDSHFGLGSAIFTQDLKRGESIAREEIEAGCCFVNGLVKSDPRLPFGGIKTSGYGRELSHHGIREFTNIKAVWIK